MEFVQPICNVTNLRAPKGVWKVVKSLELSANVRSSYLTYKSNNPPQDHTENWAARVSVAGGIPECAIVTSFKGSKLCTSRKFFPSFFITQNHLDLYEE